MEELQAELKTLVNSLTEAKIPLTTTSLSFVLGEEAKRKSSSLSEGVVRLCAREAKSAQVLKIITLCNY